MKRILVKYFSLLVFSTIISSCAKDISEYGKVSGYNSSGDRNFIFSVTEEYISRNKKSKPDSDHPQLSKAEAKLLENLLHRNNLCVNDYHNVVYEITSKQEKVYDVTFAGLIQENYNARPVVPRRYYGKCTNNYHPLEADVRRW